jgi:hypothetical protein
MNYLDQVLRITPDTDNAISDGELELLTEILNEQNIPAPNKDGVLRSVNDFYYTSYLILYGDHNHSRLLAHIKVSPHDGIFDYEKEIKKQCDITGRVSICPKLIASGKVLKDLNFSLTIGELSFPMSVAKPETIESIPKLMAGMALVCKKLDTGFAPSQEEVYKNIFSIAEFSKEIPPEFFNKLYKKYPSLEKGFPEKLSEICWGFFRDNVLSKGIGKRSLCLGPVRAQDILVDAKTSLPRILFNPYFMVGDPIIDAACLPYSIGIPRNKFYRAYAGGDANIFHEMDKLTPYSWVVDFYLTVIDELFLSTLNVQFHSVSNLNNSVKYQKYRGLLSNTDCFKDFVPQLDSIFIEKLIP